MLLVIEQMAALAASSLGDQDVFAEHGCGMELYELHILEGNTRAVGHADAASQIDEGIGGTQEDSPIPACGKNDRTRLDGMDLTGSQVIGGQLPGIVHCALPSL